jgi:hypothetical protein
MDRIRIWGLSALILLLTVVLQVPLIAQSVGQLAWSVQRPLTWADFKGKPEAQDDLHAATTYAGIRLEVEEVAFPSGKITFKTEALFDPQRSWAHPERIDEHVLAHEQLHFDIAEMYSRQLAHKLNSLSLTSKNKHLAQKYFKQYSLLQLKAQQQYDRECAHGLDKQQQINWRSKVDKELGIKRAKALAETLSGK